MFWVKKVLSQFVMPIPVSLLLITAGVLLLGYGYTRAKQNWPASLGKACCVLGVAVLALFSQANVSNALVKPLEQSYPANTNPITTECVVMVLGSGNQEQAGLSATQQLSTTSLARLTEGLKQLRLGKQGEQGDQSGQVQIGFSQTCQLIVSGWGGQGARHSHAQMMKQAAIELGVPEQLITTFDTPMDTIEEAYFAYQMIGDKPFRLVTSATHMPRSMTIFTSLGLSPQAAPADYAIAHGPWWRLSAQNLLNSQKAIHEYVGRAWLEIKGLQPIDGGSNQ
ncbi:YdcF family protein [Shewanella sp. WXL01]|uniref:YdcF family protein n=1 Tax=Shewanella maritima TaxID=2520507 RepID=A0A411PL94_9GAMM|nr:MULTISPECIES: ElyC/SanA/YdcF family protein [Shewanella]NKF51682.1 YdcF family protein [Shewanella sp. WXL01]QBF84251.1 YdcF family protein [Shewanella maritima]